jgi:uncharacterized protein (DUF2126 family)
MLDGLAAASDHYPGLHYPPCAPASAYSQTRRRHLAANCASGARNYVTFAVNVCKAESRHRARIFRMGHTPGALPEIAPDIDAIVSPKRPLTSDLTRH